MAKLTKAQFNEQNKPPVVPSEASEKDKKALISRVYNWQTQNNVYAWDEAGLQEDLGKEISIDGFVLAGVNEKSDPVEVEFFQPLDEDVEFEGVAFGFRLIMIQRSLYNLQKYRKAQKNENKTATEEEETATEEEEEE